MENKADTANWQRIAYAFTLLLGTLVVGAIFIGCSTDQAIKGVDVEKGELRAVTFRLPEGMDITTAIGSRIGESHTVGVGYMQGEKAGTRPELVHWATVNNGGIISWRDDDSRIYRYAPNATGSSSSNPPAYAVLYTEPSASDILNPSDVGRLEEKYGLSLKLG